MTIEEVEGRIVNHLRSGLAVLHDDFSPDDIRVYSISDVHTDFPANLAWLEALPSYGPGSVLILAGDVTHVQALLTRTLELFKEKFWEVFFVPGNHDLWVTSKEGLDSSVDKLVWILELCERLGVRTAAAAVTPRLVIAPLFSWYDPSFDGGDRPLSQAERTFDGGCKWPPGLGDPANPRFSLDPRIGKFMERLNAPALDFVRTTRGAKVQAGGWANMPVATGGGVDVVSFSHFLPRPELFGGWGNLAKVMGSWGLGAQVEEAAPCVHVFGHSHMRIDRNVGPTRYLQVALGYPRERGGGQGVDPRLIWSSQSGGALQGGGGGRGSSWPFG